MADPPERIHARAVAQEHTARLRELLLGKARPADPALAALELPVLAVPQAGAGRRAAAVASEPPATGHQPPGPQPLVSAEQHLRHAQGPLADLVIQLKQRVELNRILLAYLPPTLHRHATLARADTEAWVVQTDSSVWATRLRYLLPGIRQPFGERLGIPLPPPRIRIAPHTVPPPPPPPPRRMRMADDTICHLEDAARTMADPRLGAALLRLAAHARQHNRET